MEPPDRSRRKSTTSDSEDVTLKSKAHRKTFVVGGAAKNHHRIPSYGKKLNQLGKLTALTTTNAGNGTTEPVQSPRRASIHRSASQKSLSEIKGSRRNGSTQNLQKLRRSSSHQGSSTRLAALKPMTKVDDQVVAEDHRQEISASVGHSGKEEANKEKVEKQTSKRPTFVIEDDDDDDDNDEFDDVASSFANKAFLQEQQEHLESRKENGTGTIRSSDLVKQVDTAHLSSTDQKTLRKSDENTAISAHDPPRENVEPSDSAPHTLRPSAMQVRPSSSNSGWRYQPVSTPVDPKLTTDSAMSKDIQAKESGTRTNEVSMLGGRSSPVNSQPLTSRFLESPRKDSLRVSMMMSTSNTPKDGEFVIPSSFNNPAKAKLPLSHHSPHASTTNLGAGASRTQQKLLLQRASSIRDLGIESDNSEEVKMKTMSHPKAQKEIERISREYKNVRRFRDPIKEMAHRLYTRGLAMPHAQPLRRTMTQLTLNGNRLPESRVPRVSQSSANLRQQQQEQQVHMSNHLSSDNFRKALEELWNREDGSGCIEP